MDKAFKLAVGIVVALVGILGLFLQAGAVDVGIQIFGGLLFVFAVLLIFWFLKSHYDALEQGADD